MSEKKEIQAPDPKRKLFFGLFLFPLLIAAGMALLLCSVVFLTHEEETPQTLIAAIKSGSPSKRWQKAFELSNELNRRPEMIRETSVMKEIIHIMSDPAHYDAKTRSYMAMALSRFDEPEAVQAIRGRLGREEPEVQVYLIWALGNLGAKEAVPDVVPFLASENPDLRKIAAYVLGGLGDESAAAKLKPLVDDSVADVSWNAALALARLHDDSGKEVLIKMLDRKTLTLHYSMSKDQVEKIMVNAVKGLAELKQSESLPIFETLAQSDESLKVRQAALEAKARYHFLGGQVLRDLSPQEMVPETHSRA